MKNTENNFEKEIFKNASKTYFNSSLFFPKEKKQSVFELYSFVRLADDFVDSVPQNTKAFNLLKLKYQKKLADSPDKNINRVLKNIYKLQKKYPITDADVDSFLKSMSMDLTNKNYNSMEDTLEYIYGSAEVIGLMMAKILGLETESYNYACYQGRAMQYINFIRDIKEDIKLGRCYFPEIIRKKFEINSWNDDIKNNKQFDQFVQAQIEQYLEWQSEAQKGWKYIPYRSRIAVMTASDGYLWTARQIRKNPKIVFDHKVKPSKSQIILFGLKNSIKGLIY